MRIATQLGRLADALVTRPVKTLTRADLDQIVTLLRTGEARILDLEQDQRVMRWRERDARYG